MRMKVRYRLPLQRLLALPGWPPAVNPALVVDPNSDQEKRLRAYCQLAALPPIRGLAFLDFGCGEGHAVREAELMGTLSANGYDPAVPQFAAEPEGHFNLIMVHDVLDHCGGADSAVSAMRQVREYLSDGGRVHVRCHPWTSPHGGHAYRMGNLSHLHLLLDQKALPLPLHVGPPDMDPEYRRWFAAAGLAVEHHSPQMIPGPLLLPRPVAEEVFARWPLGPEHVLGPLSTAFHDYVLRGI